MGAKKKHGAEMKIESTGQSFEIEDGKRFRMPGTVISGDCPKCGAAYKCGLAGDHYLSYPVTNKPFDQGCYCGTCEHEWKVRLILRVSLEIAPAPSAKKGEG